MMKKILTVILLAFLFLSSVGSSVVAIDFHYEEPGVDLDVDSYQHNPNGNSTSDSTEEESSTNYDNVMVATYNIPELILRRAGRRFSCFFAYFIHALRSPDVFKTGIRFKAA